MQQSTWLVNIIASSMIINFATQRTYAFDFEIYIDDVDICNWESNLKPLCTANQISVKLRKFQ